MACVELPTFPLQLLLKRYPDWVGQPVAVVDRDKPQGLILQVNEEARAARIRTGMRYGAGLSLAHTLLAGEVPRADVEREVAAIAARLCRFSPDVEPCRDEPGVFRLNASGLARLHASLHRWAQEIVAALRERGFRAVVAVGFTRFGTYAVARTLVTRFGPPTVTGTLVTRCGSPAVTGTLVTRYDPSAVTGALAPGEPVAVIRDRAHERALAREVRLNRLGIDPTLRERLHGLGIRTVGAFLQLPSEGIRRRFGPEAQRLHRLAAGELWAPLQPLRTPEPLVAHHNLDDPETDADRLLFHFKRLLDRVLATAATRHQALAELTLHLRLDRSGMQTERIRPAAPTLDVVQLMNLVRLRLESLALDAGVVELRVTGRAIATTAMQQGLFAERPRRDRAAAERALARVRAEFGDEAVVRARLAEAHLPEARFAWEPVGTVPYPEPREVAPRPMVRRIHARTLALPLPLEPCSERVEPCSEPEHLPMPGGEGRYESECGGGCVRELTGPYVVSGGWWRSAVHREYYFARTQGGDMLWIYYDRPRRRWRWQGRVE